MTGVIGVLNAANGNTLQTLTGHTKSVLDIDWSPDGNHLISGSLDKTARIWDVATATELSQIQTPEIVWPVA